MIGFFGGLVVGMILLLLTQRVTNAYQKRTTQEQYVEQVARTYLELSRTSEKGKPAVQIFIMAGAARFDNEQDLASARNIILKQGGFDPLTWAKDELSEVDMLPFLKWHVQNGCSNQDYQNKEYFRKFVERFKKHGKG